MKKNALFLTILLFIFSACSFNTIHKSEGCISISSDYVRSITQEIQKNIQPQEEDFKPFSIVL